MTGDAPGIARLMDRDPDAALWRRTANDLGRLANRVGFELMSDMLVGESRENMGWLD
jgi:hypothetical protein